MCYTEPICFMIWVFSGGTKWSYDGCAIIVCQSYDECMVCLDDIRYLDMISAISHCQGSWIAIRCHPMSDILAPGANISHVIKCPSAHCSTIAFHVNGLYNFQCLQKKLYYGCMVILRPSCACVNAPLTSWQLLQCNVISHWLSTYTKCSLYLYFTLCYLHPICSVQY